MPQRTPVAFTRTAGALPPTNPNPQSNAQVGSWDDVSGEAFLRKLLSMPIEEASFRTGTEALFSNSRVMGVDPRK